jgi:hypothetical protein
MVLFFPEKQNHLYFLNVPIFEPSAALIPRPDLTGQARLP